MEKRLLFLDLDGTLLNDQKEITPGNRQALNMALQRGHGVIIATGRPLKSAMAQARKLELDQPGCYLIAYNGAVIYDWKMQESVFFRTLPLDVVCRVFDHANQKNIHIQTYDANDVLVEKRCDDADVRCYCDFTGMTFRVIHDVHTDLREEPVKMLLIDYEHPAPLQEAEQWVKENLTGFADCFFSCEEYLEIVSPGMNKGEAVTMLCRMLNIPIGQAVAVGDAANDLPMIQTAGIGVAMANGSDEVKAAADYVTQRDNNHDGIAEVVEQFLSQPVHS